MAEQQGYNLETIKKENAVLRKYAAIQAAAEEKIGCQKIYIDIAGGISDAFVLDELIFFTLPRPETGKSGLRVWKDGVLWMAVSRAEWWDRKRLTPKEADGAIERLVAKGLVLKELFLFNKQKTTHLRLNVPKFFELYTAELEKNHPPEDTADTMQKDIADLYEMLGIPFKDTPVVTPPEREQGIPEGDKVSLNGDSLNNPHTTLTQPPLNTGAGAPSLSLENQIFVGVETVTLPDNEEAKRKDAANLIATGLGVNSTLGYQIALAFMEARNITLSSDPGKVKGQRKAVKEMIQGKVKPEHVKLAVEKLTDAGMTFSDLYGVSKTAIALANPAPQAGPVARQETPEQLEARRRLAAQLLGGAG